MADGAQSTPAKPLPFAMRSSAMALDMPAQPRFENVKASTSVGVMSPVNQNGCFEFDRIIKAGNVVKRTRKTRVATYSASRTCVNG